MENTPVFVYGTLKPGEKMFHHISHTVREVLPAAIPGQLFETPFGYPLLLVPGREDEPMVSGVVLVPLEGSYEEMIRIIDVIEGEGGFDKEEMEVYLESGEKITAIVYFYHEIPAYAERFYGTVWP